MTQAFTFSTIIQSRQTLSLAVRSNQKREFICARDDVIKLLTARMNEFRWLPAAFQNLCVLLAWSPALSTASCCPSWMPSALGTGWERQGPRCSRLHQCHSSGPSEYSTDTHTHAHTLPRGVALFRTCSAVCCECCACVPALCSLCD